MKELSLITEKTARVYFSSEISSKTKEVVIALHGYAQLAKFFIKKFKSIANEERVIVVPEGLSKFYWNGMNGRVVASWMTKEDRENEIIDQIKYLDKVYAMIKKKSPEIRINVLGFSQGTATLCRWLATSEPKIDRVLLWAGGIPEDVIEKSFFNNKQLEIIIGLQDEYISEETTKSITKKLIDQTISFDLVNFDGTHIIDNPTLINLFS